jgi:dTMP kinase
MSKSFKTLALADSPAVMLEKRARLIVLIGNDGAGKSTQAQRLVDWLTARGEVALLHPNESLQPIKSALNAVAAERGVADAEALLGRETSQIAYVALKWNTMIKMREALGQPGVFVVLDRYAYCHIASVRAQGLRCREIVEELFGVFPKPDLTLFLDVTPQTAIERMVRRAPNLPPLSRDYLEAHARAYWTLPAAADFVRVDGEQSADAVHSRLRTEVARRFGLRRSDGCLTPLPEPGPIGWPREENRAG